MIAAPVVTARELGGILLEAGLKGIVVFVIAAVVAWSLRRRPASARHGVWAAALSLQLALPVLAVLVPAWRVPLLSRQQTAAVTSAITAAVTPADTAAVGGATVAIAAADTSKVSLAVTPARTAVPGATSAAIRAATAPAQPQWYASPAIWFAALWLLGCIVVLGRLALGTMHVSRMAVTGERVVDGRWLSLITRLAQSLGIRRPLTLLRGNSLGVPVTWGIVYPVVLLPDDADQWPEERRRYVLVHEMAHVKRFDALTQLVGQITLALFWFNPLTWVAARRLIVEREHACDDYVLRHGTKASEYASDLLEMVRSIGSIDHRAAEPAFAALAMARRSEFEGRMLSILDPDLDRKPISRTGAFMSVATSLIIALPLAAFSPFGRVVVNDSHANADSAMHSATTAQHPRPATAQTARRAQTANWIGTCDTSNLSRAGTSNHVEVHSGDGDQGLTEYVYQGAGRCVEARIMGTFALNGDETDITSLPFGSSAFFRERTSSTDRQVRISSDANGDLQRSYRLNGNRADWDAEAQQWFSRFLPSVLAEAGVNAKERVARLRASGGVPAVLSMIGSLHGPGARTAHYSALLDEGNLSGGDLEQILRHARTNLAGSSGDLTSVLEKLPLRGAHGAAISSALADALGGITSDGDKANAAILIVQQEPGDPDVLLAAAKAALTIHSSGDKANFLIVGAPRYLTAKNDALRGAFFAVADSVQSDGDKANVLISAAPYGHADENVTLNVIHSSIAIRSSGDKANVLTTVASQHLLTSKTIREEFLKAVATIGSDGDRANVLSMAIRQ